LSVLHFAKRIGLQGVLLIWLLGVIGSSEEWPQFGQNYEHTSVLLNAQTSPIIPNVLWSYDVPSEIIYSSPVVSNGMVYIGSNFDTTCSAPARIYAFEADTGALAWSIATPGSIGDGSAAVINGVLVVGAGNTIFGLDALTGAIRWQQSYYGTCFQESFITAVPELDAVFLSGIYIPDQSGYIYSLKASSGELRFSYQIAPAGAATSEVFAAPVYVSSQGYVAFNAYTGKMYALDANDGSERWITPLSSDRFYATPAYDSVDGQLYTGGFDGLVYALNVNGTVLWSYQTNGRIIASPAVVRTDSGKHILVASEDGVLYVLNGNGELQWQYSTGEAIYSSPAISGEGTDSTTYVYLATYGGKVYVLDMGGNLVSSPSIPASLGGEFTWSSPAVADRRIFIATGKIFSPPFGEPSRIFFLGDNNLSSKTLLTLGTFYGVEVGSYGDTSITDHLPGVSLWQGANTWGEPTLFEGHSVRSPTTSEAEFMLNLQAAQAQQLIELQLTYKADASFAIYQYDGSQYQPITSLTADGVWQSDVFYVNPSFYVDYDGDGSNGMNVLFKMVLTGSYFYLDRIEVANSLSTDPHFRVTQQGDIFSDGAYFCGLPDDPLEGTSCFNASMGADIAEYVRVSEPVEAGEVVEMDPIHAGFYRKSRAPHSRLTGGVIATAPGMTLGGPKDKSQEVTALLALVGVVPVKVTAENGSIRPGDLLTTSSTRGYAMRCNDPQRCEGTLLGKALEFLPAGQGLIKMLVLR
jgi:outer membrane protein assembly factor BamB